MKFLHTMVRVRNLDESIYFYCSLLGLEIIRELDYKEHGFKLIFLASKENPEMQIELTYNYEDEIYTHGRSFGHLAFEVDNIYQICQKFLDNRVKINVPPKDGKMAFVKSPDGISIELLQKGEPLKPKEPWLSMPKFGTW